MKRSKVLTSIMVAILVSNGIVATAQQQQQQATILVGPNVMVTEEREGLAREHLIATHPTDPKRLLASSHVRQPRIGGMFSDTQVYRSVDGGYSWRKVALGEHPLMEDFFDPLVVYGRTGTGIVVTQIHSKLKRGSIISYRSEDGLFWEKPILLGSPDASYDHPQITVDRTGGRFAGNIYVTAANKTGPELFRSADDGRRWEGPVNFVKKEAPTEAVNTMPPLVFSDGELFIPTHHRLKPREDGSLHFKYVTSKDGGKTFSPSLPLTDKNGKAIYASGYGMGYFALDAGKRRFRDRIYLVWTDWGTFDPISKQYSGEGIGGKKPATAFHGVYFSYSSDRGRTWEVPRLISPGGRDADHQFVPSVAVNRDGVVAVSWYDTKDTPVGVPDLVVNRYITASLDGGASFLPPARVSSASFRPAVLARNVTGSSAGSYRVQGNDPNSVVYRTSLSDGLAGGYGHYFGLEADAEGTFHDLWTDGRTGSDQAWTARVKVVTGKSEQPSELVDADVTDMVEPYVEPPALFGAAPGTAKITVRFRNRSDRPIYGPLSVEVSDVRPDGIIVGAANGKSGLGAAMDYSRALGDFASLPPGAITEGVAWTLRIPPGAGELPRFFFKVTGKVEKSKKAATVDR